MVKCKKILSYCGEWSQVQNFIPMSLQVFKIMDILVPCYYACSSACGNLKFLRTEPFSLSPENFKIITNYFTYMHTTQAIAYVTLMLMVFLGGLLCCVVNVFLWKFQAHPPNYTVSQPIKFTFVITSIFTYTGIPGLLNPKMRTP
jgi:hypothetical protein